MRVRSGRRQLVCRKETPTPVVRGRILCSAIDLRITPRFMCAWKIRTAGLVYATYSLGRVLAYDEPQKEIDRANQLHILHCSAPRTWAYSHIGLDGQLLKQSTFMETKTRPHLRRTSSGEIAVSGGALDVPATQAARSAAPKLSTRPPDEAREEHE